MISLPNHNKKNGVISTVLICGVLIATSFFLVNNKQEIVDQVTFWQYQPTSEISAIIDRTGMNDYGKFLFYASQPTLDGTKNFNTECTKTEQTTSIFGCYSDSKIYIYNITDKQLDGIEEVTAAHETLHAAYARMDEGEMAKVDALLEVEYEKLKTDSDFADLIAYYERSEPGQRYNELHSIIGTEVVSVSSELEAHYSKYFSNRQAVVTLNANYISVFKKLETRATELSGQLDALATGVAAKRAQYNADVESYNADVAAFKTKAENNEFYTLAEYNREYSNLTARKNALDSTRVAINSDIANYNSLLTEYNSIVSQSKELYSSMDSTLAPAVSAQN